LGSTKGVDGPVKPGHDGVEESGPASFGIIYELLKSGWASSFRVPTRVSDHDRIGNA
jgi:hypothetical protein